VFADESGTTTPYAIEIDLEPHGRRGFLEGLCDELGLVVTPDKREVELLVVNSEAATP
jgi:hypothetical protein